MGRHYCKHCNERIVQNGSEWHALAKRANPEYGNALHCPSSLEGHEPRD